MKDFIFQNKEVLAFCVSFVGILLSFCFGGMLGWRNKICLDYESRRDVAINILRDKFVQRTSSHYSEIEDERRNRRTEVQEIYKRPEQQDMIRELAATLEDQNRVKRYFRWLDRSSHAGLLSLWAAIVLTVVAIFSLWMPVPTWLIRLWFGLGGVSVLVVW